MRQDTYAIFGACRWIGQNRGSSRMLTDPPVSLQSGRRLNPEQRSDEHMGNHRADVAVDTRPSVETPYVGKRRAAPAPDASLVPAAETPQTTYVGKRRRVLPEEQATTLEVATLEVPAPRRTVEPLADAPSIETLSDQWADLRIDTGSLPPLNETAAYATDFGAETTTTLPVVNTGKRRADGARRTGTLIRRMPSTPMLVGVAALAISVGGAVTAAHTKLAPASSGRFVAASALTGASDVGRVGTHRATTVSRNADREALADQAANAAAQRAATLDQLDTKAAARDKWMAANQWGLPIQAGEYHLTGRFGDVSGLWATVHTGLDFACPTGTPIHAVAGGTITDIGWAGSYGNRTVETLPDGTELWYAHQSRFGATVGEKVTEGEVIGYVGSTGNTTGPHVHLEVRPGGGDPVDPDPALKAHGIDPDANQ
jgi:murein DD-endopeptidase MepM/ murein hydrolase activator NlpD